MAGRSRLLPWDNTTSSLGLFFPAISSFLFMGSVQVPLVNFQPPKPTLPGQETEEEQQLRALFTQVAGEVGCPGSPAVLRGPASPWGCRKVVVTLPRGLVPKVWCLRLDGAGRNVRPVHTRGPKDCHLHTISHPSLCCG